MDVIFLGLMNQEILDTHWNPQRKWLGKQPQKRTLLTRLHLRGERVKAPSHERKKTRSEMSAISVVSLAIMHRTAINRDWCRRIK
jgi:hypothetical protein